jgi:hypothetical protein
MEALCTVLGDAEPTLTVFRCGQNDCRFDTVVQLRGWHDLRCDRRLAIRGRRDSDCSGVEVRCAAWAGLSSWTWRGSRTSKV